MKSQLISCQLFPVVVVSTESGKALLKGGNYLLFVGKYFPMCLKAIKNPAGYAGFLDCLADLSVTFDYLRSAKTDCDC